MFVIQDYSVTLGGKETGRVQVERQGLYYRIFCRCKLSGEVMYRLVAACGERTADLGILVPTESGFGVETRIPVSRLGEGTLSFSLRPKHDEATIFVPIRPEEPFAYLSHLRQARLEYRDGQLGASFSQKLISRETGQWSEPNTSA